MFLNNIDYSKWMFNWSPATGTSWMSIKMERCTYLGFAAKQ